MGRKRSLESESTSQESDNTKDINIIFNYENSSRKRMKTKYNDSQAYNYKLLEINKSEYTERRKHGHKHKKHTGEESKHRNKQLNEDTENRRQNNHYSKHEMRSRYQKYNDDSGRHSTHRNREKHRHGHDVYCQDKEYKTEHQRTKWSNGHEEAKVNFPRLIKNEPISHDANKLINESRNESPRNNYNCNTFDNRQEKIDGNEKLAKNMPLLIKEYKPEPYEKINMGLSGKLTEDTNMYNGIVIKYSQPPEARKPKRRWRWYIFKGDKELPFLPLHRQSAYLIGRERKVADIPTDHPSCSKQHAVLQYRMVSYEKPDGIVGCTVKPYILDLESANGTYVNNRLINPKCYVELFERDVVKFGYSTREYVLLHEESKGDELPIIEAGEMDLSPVSLLRSQDSKYF